MFMKRFAVSLLMFLAFYTCASAQRSDVGFVAGVTFSNGFTGVPACEALPVCPSSGHLSIEPGFTFEGSYAYRLADFKVASVHLELPLVFSPSRKANTSLLNRDTFSTFFFTPSVKLKLLPGAGVSPFVSAGGGLAHFGENSTSNSTGAFQLGGGLDFKTHLPVLGFRIEARDFISGRPGTSSFAFTTSDHVQHIFVGGGITLHF